MSNKDKHRVAESFREFIMSTELHQSGEIMKKYDYGSNPDVDENYSLPFEFERRPEIGERSNESLMILEKMQAIIEAAINKHKQLDSQGEEMGPYVKRQLGKAYVHLREGYLRLMDRR